VLTHFKTLATPSLTAMSPRAYFEQLDTSKHCFAICVLFVLNKIQSNYAAIEDIQSQHNTLPATYLYELSPPYLQEFQVRETCSESLSMETFKTHYTRFDQINHAIIVLTSKTQKRHSLAFRSKRNSPYAEILNTSGQSGVPKIQTIQRPYSETLGAYMDSLIEKNERIGNEIQTIRIIMYEADPL